MNSKKKYTVAIIGAGRIGTGFDGPSSKEILTHAHAFQKHARTVLVALVDTDAARARKEGQRWNVPAYTDLSKMFSEAQPDIVVIATPDSTHAALLIEVAAYSPKLIICEKPVVATSVEARSLVKHLKKVPVIVNFSYRFAETIVLFRERLHAGLYGKVLSARATYTKGVLHNGSHVLDLARYFFGELQTVHIHSAVHDFPEGKPTLGGVLSFAQCAEFHLMAGNEKAYSMFEFEVLTEHGRFRIQSDGAECVEQAASSSSRYKGYRTLGVSKVQPSGLLTAISALATHAVAVLDGKEKPRTSLEDALLTYEACARLLVGAGKKL